MKVFRDSRVQIKTATNTVFDIKFHFRKFYIYLLSIYNSYKNLRHFFLTKIMQYLTIHVLIRVLPALPMDIIGFSITHMWLFLAPEK